jgi:dihydroorotate dehydrogenase (NAD+) catalytic subunit
MIEISSGKHSLQLQTPVLGGAGIFGFAGEYGKLLPLDLLGAVVTNPITYRPRRPANGTRVVPLDSGFLLHTGLPNPGFKQCYKQNINQWRASQTPIILHVVATAPDDLSACAKFLEEQAAEDEGVIAGIELGLGDNATPREVKIMIGALRSQCLLPILAKLPLYLAPQLANAALEAGANALVVAAPPRGTARDTLSGQLVGGRVYGPWLKSLALRAVGQVAHAVAKHPEPVVIIGTGGIHHPNDARDFLEAGAACVQLDSVAWIRPDMVERIARDLGGLDLTRQQGAFPDEWGGGVEFTASFRAGILPSAPPAAVPSTSPEE